MKTYSQKPAEVTRKWYVIDASQAPLGRVATAASSLLIGKAKPTVTSHVDGGDYVIIINASKFKVTGNKLADKIYYKHSGFPGGLKTKTLGELGPSEAIYKAVRGMLPVNKLRPGRLERLKIYESNEHEHQAQTPETFELKVGK